jgi:hypothetical protein
MRGASFVWVLGLFAELFLAGVLLVAAVVACSALLPRKGPR